MLQYLLNLTGIWLLSLVVYDIFLRKESYHAYNRTYLLVTMIAGIAFPLVKWQPTASRLYTAVERPVGTVLSAKGNIVAAAESANAVTWEQWLMVLYAIGATVMAGLLVSDIAKLAGYYRAGRKSAIEGWALVETGKDHAPFSFLNLLFVSDRNDYSSEEWQMLIEHEGRHTSLLHVIDLVLLQITRIVLWFHPLVYVYNKRLLMVHEYQADNAAAQQPAIYGRFLAEQAVLHAAPSITHSFNRSPIKKRILMLTTRSTTIARTKMVMVLPLTLACLVLFSQISYSKRFDRQGNKVTYRVNTFEYGAPGADTIIVINAVTGGADTKITKRDGLPEKMNGKKIYQTCDLTQHPQTFIQNVTIQDYVFRNLYGMLNELPDGIYDLDVNNIVIDENGKIVYYEGKGFRQYNDQVTPKIAEAIADKVDELLHNAPAMVPGKANGIKVPSLYRASFVNYEIEVKDHQSTLKETSK